MKNLLPSILLFILFAFQAQGNIHINSYNIALEIIPENKSIKAQADLNFSIEQESTDSLALYLHKEFYIIEI